MLRAPLAMLLVSAACVDFIGCIFDATVDARARFLCHSSEDCPPSFECAAGVCANGRDVTPPALVDVSFTPSIARGGTPVELDVTASEALREAPALTFAGTSPTFTASDVSGTRASFTFDVPATGADDAVELVAVALTDAAGNRSNSGVDDVLPIDRTAPTLTNLVSDRVRYSGVAPFNSITAAVDAGEALDAPPASFLVLLGTAPLQCGTFSSSSPSYQCTRAIDDAVPGGALVLQAVGVDRAGNISVLGIPVVVDRAPPVIVAGATTLSVRGPGDAVTAPTLIIGTHVAIEITADEVLSAATVTAVGPSTFTLLSTVDGSQVTATFDVDTALPLGEYEVHVVLVDDVGNASADTVVDLPAPGLVSSEDVPSPCIAHYAQGNAECTDFDGDGFFGASPFCDSFDATDCNDDDPFVHPGATDLPGDHNDNGCNGSQGVAIDESSGVFVAVDGDDTAAGTRAAPFATLERATLELGARAGIYMKQGTYSGVGATVLSGPAQHFVIVGGLDDQWSPVAAARSTISLRCGTPAVSSDKPLFFVDVDVQFDPCPALIEAPAVSLRRASLSVDCGASTCSVNAATGGTFFAHQSELTGVTLDTEDTSIMSSTLTDVTVFGSTALLLRVHVIGGVLAADVSLRLLDVASTGELFPGASLEMLHSTLLTDRIFNRVDSDMTINNSIVVADVLLDQTPSSPSVSLDGSDLFVPCVLDSCPVFDVATSFCGWPGCFDAAFAIDDDPRLASDGVHLTVDSPVRNVGLSTLINTDEHELAGTAIAADIDGHCRDNSSPDMGAERF